MCVDIFDKTIMPGGESLNFAATISRLTDAKVYIIGAVGNDSYGKTVLDSIKDFNIDKTHIRTENGDTAYQYRGYALCRETGIADYSVYL